MKAIEEKHTAKRIGYKKYLYRGFIIQGYAYYEPEQSPVWEAYSYYSDNPNIYADEAFAHAFTLRDCKRFVDYELDK